jgi:hypothetical protein
MVKTQNTLLLSSNCNFLSPLILVVLGGGSSWPADARSTQDAPSPMGYLLGKDFLVQAVEAAYRSGQLELRQPKGFARGCV